MEWIPVKISFWSYIIT